MSIPSDAQSIQLRVAFFSQEFPAYVNSKFNDSFKIKFKESPGFIASGNVNDLAGDAYKHARVREGRNKSILR